MIPTPEPTAEPTAEPTPAPERRTYPCSGKGGSCPFVTYREDDPFCRSCDFTDDGTED